MKSVTLIFPGQGSQYVGMGESLQNNPKAKEIFQLADSTLGYSLSELCFKGPSDKLKQTEFTQPALLTHSIALYEGLKVVLNKHNISIKQVLGHSVGEYSALVAAKALDFPSALKAVSVRGKSMQQACPEGQGKMAAILRVPTDIVKKACEESSINNEKVMCANFNSPGQIVISGDSIAVDRAITWLKENYEGKQMAKELAVSAPFHSSLMEPAQIKLASFFEQITFQANELPYIANVDAKRYQAIPGEQIKESLTQQVCASVLWEQSISQLDDSDICLEVGPGKVLTGLNKRINPSIKTFALDQDESFKELEDFFHAL